MGKLTDYLLLTYFAFMLIFVYAPIILVVIFSFNSGTGTTFPIEGFSTRWYVSFFSNGPAIRALIESLKLALIVMGATTVLCVVTALAFRRGVRGKETLLYLVLLGILTPGVVYGLGAGLFYSEFLGTGLSIWTAVPIEVVWTLPFGLILMLARFDPELASYEAAARTLGANERQVFREVTLPLISVHTLAVALFSFTLTFGELMRALFVTRSPPILSVWIFSWISNSPLTPDFYAIGTLTIGISFFLLLIAGLLLFRGHGKKII